jgi:hypothetical protein
MSDGGVFVDAVNHTFSESDKLDAHKNICKFMYIVGCISLICIATVNLFVECLKFRALYFTRCHLEGRLVTETCASEPLTGNGLFRLSGVMSQYYKQSRAMYYTLG